MGALTCPLLGTPATIPPSPKPSNRFVLMVLTAKHPHLQAAVLSSSSQALPVPCCSWLLQKRSVFAQDWLQLMMFFL